MEAQVYTCRRGRLLRPKHILSVCRLPAPSKIESALLTRNCGGPLGRLMNLVSIIRLSAAAVVSNL